MHPPVKTSLKYKGIIEGENARVGEEGGGEKGEEEENEEEKGETRRREKKMGNY